MSTTWAGTWCALLAAALLAAPPADAQEASPVRIHVRGSAQIEALAWSEPGGFVVRGAVIDDAGVPITRAPLSIQIVAGGPARREMPPATACASVDPIRATPEGFTLETDERGGFCLRGRGTIEGEAAVRVRFAWSSHYEAALVSVPVDAKSASLAAVDLRFDPPTDAIDLDRESVTVSATLRIDQRGSGLRVRGSLDRRDPSRAAVASALQREGLALVLEDERGATLSEATTGGDGRARFDVKTERLAGPGQGELRVRFDGGAAMAKASVSQPVVRRAEVALALAHPLVAADADDGIPIDVTVSSSRGAVDGGVVEALRAGESVGAGAVQEGTARVIAALASDRVARIPVTLRYVPAAPWWRPGPELAIEVPVAGPGVWRQVALGALVLAIAGWVLGGWRRAPKPKAPADQEARAAPPSGRAGVHVVGPSEDARGWRGIVTDAHEGTPIANAELMIVVPAFDGSGVVARATTDDSGAFLIEAMHRNDARLIVQAATHSAHEQALPPPSTLGVALVTRRRALLDRLVRWTRRHGAPYEGPPEPTPGHVRRVAGRAHDPEIEQWATGVEHAAFGLDPVDEHVERDLRGVEPRHGPRGTG